MSPFDLTKERIMSEYSDKSFWEKVKKFALAAGRDVVLKALELYYAAKDKDTPVWAKTVIYGALLYFISPMDAIPDIIPVVGYSDDLGALVAAAATVSAHITPEMEAQAKSKLTDWFG